MREMRRTIFALAMCAAAVIAMGAPATAYGKPAAGDRISLFSPPTSFAANSPFYIEHGFACELGDRDCLVEQFAKGDFDLYLDGTLQASTPDVGVTDGILRKLHLTNYPSGLPAGTYTFVGIWTIDRGTLLLTMTATITFD